MIEITDVFDLHTIQPRDVKAVVEEYLYQAHAKGFPVVRIIHGKGIGVQREIVRTVLSRTSFVIDLVGRTACGGRFRRDDCEIKRIHRLRRFHRLEREKTSQPAVSCELLCVICG